MRSSVWRPRVTLRPYQGAPAHAKPKAEGSSRRYSGTKLRKPTHDKQSDSHTAPAERLSVPGRLWSWHTGTAGRRTGSARQWRGTDAEPPAVGGYRQQPGIQPADGLHEVQAGSRGGLVATATARTERNARGRIRIAEITIAIRFGRPAAEMEDLDRVLESFEAFSTISQSVRQGAPLKDSVDDDRGVRLKD